MKFFKFFICIFLTLCSIALFSSCQNGEYERVEYSLRSKVETLDIQLENFKLEICKTAENSYIEYEKGGYSNVSLIENNGKLIIKEEGKFFIHLFNSVPTPKFTLYLKEEITDAEIEVSNGAVILNEGVISGSAEIELSNGNVTFNSLNARSLSAEVSNGNISCENLTVTEEVDLCVSNGLIDLNNCNLKNLSGEVSNGNISCKNLTANNIELEVNVGNIEVEIFGEQNEYKTQASVSVGSCNIHDTNAGEKQLKLSVDVGNVNVVFING